MADHEFRITQIGSAVEQLEWAIYLLVEKNAPLPAVTLAAAAEELLGKMVTGTTAMAELRDYFVTPELDGTVVLNKHLNHLKNWLKHGSKTESSIVVQLEFEAVQYLARALTNLGRVTGSGTPMGALFQEWIDCRPYLTAGNP